jgi:serine/threonine-protein kinase
MTRSVGGSATYRAPEYLRATIQADARSDVWSVGCVLYELLTGVSPFDSGGVVESCAAVLAYEPAAPSTVCRAVCRELDAVVMRCLRKTPDQRFGDVAELAEALAPFGNGLYAGYAARCAALLAGANTTRPSTVEAQRAVLLGTQTAEAGEARASIPASSSRQQTLAFDPTVALPARHPLAQIQTVLVGAAPTVNVVNAVNAVNIASRRTATTTVGSHLVASRPAPEAEQTAPPPPEEFSTGAPRFARPGRRALVITGLVCMVLGAAAIVTRVQLAPEQAPRLLHLVTPQDTH